jgi:hypothetical protein
VSEKEFVEWTSFVILRRIRRSHRKHGRVQMELWLVRVLDLPFPEA